MADSRSQRYMVVVFDGVSLGIMSFAFSAPLNSVAGAPAAPHLEPDVLIDDIHGFYATIG